MLVVALPHRSQAQEQPGAETAARAYNPEWLGTLLPVPSDSLSNNWVRRMFLKSNGVGWALLVGNAAVEVETSPRWSVGLAVYYSALNYFARTTKFRTVTLIPEVRYYFSHNLRWHASAHLGVAWFNGAVNNSKYRIQDKNGTWPMWGAGIGAGYRFPLSPDKRWGMDLSIGVGVYDLYYDKFLNEPNGAWVGSVHKPYFGPDNLTVSVYHIFDLYH